MKNFYLKNLTKKEIQNLILNEIKILKPDLISSLWKSLGPGFRISKQGLRVYYVTPQEFYFIYNQDTKTLSAELRKYQCTPGGELDELIGLLDEKKIYKL